MLVLSLFILRIHRRTRHDKRKSEEQDKHNQSALPNTQSVHQHAVLLSSVQLLRSKSHIKGVKDGSSGVGQAAGS